MARRLFIWMGLLLLAPVLSLRAVENSSTGTYNESAPTGSDISNWLTGWTQPATQPAGTTYTTGWNYVGSVNGATAQASGVYLGAGWVITCAHVGAGPFTLNGTTYNYVANTMHTFSGTVTTTTVTSTGTTTSSALEQADFILFQVSPAPALPMLPIRTSDPVPYQSHVALIGYGDGGNLTHETWGNDLLDSYADVVVNLLGFWTNDSEILTGDRAEYEIVSGDSGGGAFIYNTTASRWELAGLSEAALDNSANSMQVGSAFVQLNDSSFSNTYSNYPNAGETTTYSGTTTYASQIAQILAPASDTPAMPMWALVALVGVLLGVAAPAVLPERK
jgi:hypothetical protein